MKDRCKQFIACPALIAAAVLVGLTTKVQAQEQIWALQFGTSEWDVAHAIASDGAAGVVVAGETRGALGAPNAGSLDAFIARYDSAGTQIWVSQFGTIESDTALALASDGVGGAMIAGTTSGDLTRRNAGFEDLFLARYDSLGNQLWIRQIGTTNADFANALAPDGAGGVMIAGTTLGGLGGQSAGAEDIFLARYNSAGSRIWIRQIGTISLDGATAVASDGAGGAVVAGWSYGSLGSGNQGGSDVVLLRYDDSGNLLWRRQFGTTSDDKATAIVLDNEGVVVIAGYSEGSLGGPSAGTRDAFVARYDLSGAQLWIHQFGTSTIDQASSIATDGAEGVIVAGYTSGSLGRVGLGSSDAFLARYDQSGEQLWLRQFGTRELDRARAIVYEGAGTVMVAGSTMGLLGGTALGGSDSFLARYVTGSCYADCDVSTGYGVLDIFDFLCFQQAFTAGCTFHQVDHRVTNWVPGAAHGTTINNPSSDLRGRPLWSYEVVTGLPLGAFKPWFMQSTRRSTWDEDWFGTGQGAWSQGDDLNPPIFQNRMTHSMAATSWADIPIVRWLNPAGNNSVVNIDGSLTVRWSGDGGVGSPVDVDVVIAMNDVSMATWDVLYSTTVSKPIPQQTIGDEIILPINLEQITLDEGDSIVVSHRAKSDSGLLGRWIVLLDDLTITGVESECYADCDSSGTLDIFDFLCFQNEFVAGCP